MVGLSTAPNLNPVEVRQALSSFWDEQLSVRTFDTGLVLALPLILPDGLQIVVKISPVSSSHALLSDAGDVLKWLITRGINVDSDANKEWIEDRLTAFGLRKSGLVITSEIALPVQGLDIHVFGEALVSIAHLFIRHETEEAYSAPAHEQIIRAFKEVGVEYSTNRKLSGAVEDAIKVDYYFQRHLPSAIQVLQKKDRIIDTMERWGFRWSDLRRKTPELRTAMIYDPDRQSMDAVSRRIGEGVCTLFCAYYETERIMEFVAN